jgi:fungal STAND N-terminal Goodbye domain
MSHNPPEPEATPRSKYEVIFDKALKAYEKTTGKDLKSDPLLHTLEACNSPDETLSELRQQIHEFDQSENGHNRLTNWVKPVVDVLYIYAQTIGGAVGLVSLDRF